MQVRTIQDLIPTACSSSLTQAREPSSKRLTVIHGSMCRACCCCSPFLTVLRTGWKLTLAQLTKKCYCTWRMGCRSWGTGWGHSPARWRQKKLYFCTVVLNSFQQFSALGHFKALLLAFQTYPQVSNITGLCTGKEVVRRKRWETNAWNVTIPLNQHKKHIEEYIPELVVPQKKHSLRADSEVD